MELGIWKKKQKQTLFIWMWESGYRDSDSHIQIQLAFFLYICLHGCDNIAKKLHSSFFT